MEAKVTTPYDLWSEIQGVPFVDDTFHSSKMLTIVAAFRRVTARVEKPLAEFLNPEIACSIYGQSAHLATRELAYTPLSAVEHRIVQAASDSIATAIPSWSTLVRIPIRYYKLASEQLSLTNPLLPQTVFLSDRAIEDQFTLIETLVHELSHVWMGFICELFDFQKRDNTEQYTLPSGTSGKDMRGLIFASTFAASVLRYYRLADTIKPDDRVPRRIDRLAKYFSGTIESLKMAKDASIMSTLIIERLCKFHQSPTQCKGN